MTTPIPLLRFWNDHSDLQKRDDGERHYQAGFMAGQNAAATVFAGESETERSLTDSKHRLDREQWAEREATLLAEQIQSRITELNNTLADAVAAILKPFLDAATFNFALSEFASAVTELLEKEKQPAIEIRCRGDLMARLQTKLPPRLALTFVESADVEVKAVAERTVIETRLSEWLQSWEGAAHAR